MLRCLTALLLAGLAGAAAAAPGGAVEGTVTRVVDGDTLWFAVPGKAPLVVRLRDIDAPEICQPWGEQSRRALAELALNKPATLRPAARDVHGRTLGTLRVDDVDVGPRMVEDGQAWSTRTRYDQGPLVKQERMAKALGRGFHAQAGNQMPWHFRQVHGACNVEGQAPAAAGVPAPGAAPTAGRRPLPAPAVAAPLPQGGGVATWRCDGRTQCSQMTSCEEARYFLANCRGVKMDGNRDGLPCEVQWCGGNPSGGRR